MYIVVFFVVLFFFVFCFVVVSLKKGGNIILLFLGIELDENREDVGVFEGEDYELFEEV